MVLSGYGWLWAVNGWLRVVINGFGMVSGGYRLQVVLGVYEWLLVVMGAYWVVTGGYGWLLVLL